MTEKVKEKLEYCNNNPSDELIIKTFITKTKCNSYRLNGTYTKYIKNYENIKKYLYNRYINGEKDISEILYRIFNHIDIPPKCKECGKPVKFKSFCYGYLTFCCSHCARINKDTLQKKYNTNMQKYGSKTYVNPQKAKQTCLERYGNENYKNFEKYKQTCLERYGVINTLCSTIFRNKAKQTCLQRYGVESPMQSKEIKEKVKITMRLRYGIDWALQNKEIRKKIKQTNIDKYGVTYFNNPIKTKQTLFDKYGETNCMRVQHIKEKQQKTMFMRYGQYTSWNTGILREKQYQACLKKYGVKCYSQTDEFKQWNSNHMKSQEIQEKILNTKRKNHTFNSSKIEQQFKEYLEQNYPNDFEYQYKSELYPFNCDFYIKSLDLYIEIQGDWRHGYHPFNANNQDDIIRLNKLKNLEYLKLIINKQLKTDYSNAINTWTIRDPEKRKYAKNNNLNYLEIFSNDINVVIQEFNTYINKIK